MPNLTQRFESATHRARGLKKQPTNHELLQLYALYKQATSGDVTGPSPGAFDFRAHAKYTAWAKEKGVAREAAMRRYIALVVALEAE